MRLLGQLANLRLDLRVRAAWVERLHRGNLRLQRRDLARFAGNGQRQARCCLAQLIARFLLLLLKGALLAVQLVFGVGKLRLAFVDALLGVVELRVHAGQKLVVDVFDLAVGKAHFNGLFRCAHRGNIGNAVHALKLGDGLVLHQRGGVVDIVIIVGSGNVQGRHHVHADFHVVGAARSFRQLRGNLVHRRRGLHHGRIHVGAVLKLKEHHGIVVGTLALDGGNAAYLGKGALQHISYFRLHLFGAGARVGGDNGQIRQVHIGQKVGFHLGERNTTQNKDDDHRNRNNVRLLNAKAAKHSNSLGRAIKVGFE